jgi:competence protein ComEC
VRRLKARQVVVSAGWKSRYGHPREEVLQRWRASGAAIDNTAASGAIRIAWDGDGGRTLTRYRHQARRFWHR